MNSAAVIAFPPLDRAWAPVGERLRELRQARGLSRDQLAREMRLPKLQLALAEAGRSRLTSGQLYAASLALRAPMRLLFEPALDASALPNWADA